MHGVDMLIDAIALKYLKKETLSTLELFEKITQERKLEWPESARYQSTQRLRFRGLIEEVKTTGKTKPYRLTRKGNKVVKEICEIFKESEV